MTTIAHQCWQCKEFYPRTLEFFRPKRINSDGLAGNCRHCTNANRRKARAEKKAARLVIKPTAAQRHKAYRQRKKAERFAQISGVIQHGQS